MRARISDEGFTDCVCMRISSLSFFSFWHEFSCPPSPCTGLSLSSDYYGDCVTVSTLPSRVTAIPFISTPRNMMVVGMYPLEWIHGNTPYQRGLQWFSIRYDTIQCLSCDGIGSLIILSVNDQDHIIVFKVYGDATIEIELGSHLKHKPNLFLIPS